MPGLIDTVYVRIRPMIAGFAEETTAGIRTALTDVNAQVAESARASVAASGQEVAANKAVADSYLGIAEAAQAPVRSLEEVQAAAKEQMATIDAVAQTNVAAVAREQEANVALAASYQKIAASAVAGSEEQIAATKLAAEASVKAGLEIKASADESAAAVGGIKSHFLSLGNVLGIGFGAAIGVDLVKHVVADAGQVQKSAEVIKSAFGPAANRVFVGFRDSVAANLGISAQLADATSARFGIFFHNVGIAGPAAARMTVGFEKLAGSLSMIRGVDPSAVMQNIVLAAEGNTRGLKQLGIALSTTQEEAYAALHGISASATTALTPAQKAEAIFGLATQKLGYDMQEAKKHAGDLTSVTFRLRAEFSNAEDALGKALLPTFKKYTTELADWLGRMEKSGRLQRDFNEAASVAKGIIDGVVNAVKIGVSIWDGFKDAVGGTTNAVTILLTVMAVSKFAAIISTVKNLVGTVVSIGTNAMAAAGRVGVAFGLIDAASLETGLTIRTALIETGIGAIVVAAGIAAAYVVTHWDQVKSFFENLGHKIVHDFDYAWTEIKRGAIEAALGVVEPFSHLPSFLGGWARKAKTSMQKELDKLHPPNMDYSSTALKDGAKTGYFWWHGFKYEIPKDFIKDPGGIEGRYFKDGQLSGKGWAAGFAFEHKKILDQSRKDAFKQPQIPFALFAAEHKNLPFDQQQMLYEQYVQGLSAIQAAGRSAEVQRAAKDAGKSQANAVLDQMKQILSGPTAASTLTAPLKPVLDQLQNAITAARQKIQSTIMDAKNNLTKIGDDLAKTIEQIQAKLGGAAGAIAGSPQGQAFAKLKKLIESGAPSFEIARAQAALGNQLKDVGKQQQPLIKTQLDNLTAEFNKGQIGYRQFEERLHKILHDDGVTLQQALKAGGPAFADAFRAQVAALGKQATQIADIPAKYRGIGGAGGAADLKIIRPLDVIRQENTKIAAAATHQRDEQIRYANEMVKYQANILKLQEKENALIQQFVAAGATRAQAQAAARKELGPIPSVRDQGRATVAGAGASARSNATASARDSAVAKIPSQLQQSRTDQARIGATASTERRSSYSELVKIVGGLQDVCHGITSAQTAITRPIEQLHDDNVHFETAAARQRDRQLRATDQTNRELRQLRRGTGRTPGFGNQLHGKASHDARLASRIHS